MMKDRKIIFFGTAEFAVPILYTLHQNEYNVALVVTLPDKSVGRKQISTPPPIKVAALKLGYKVIQDLKQGGLKDYRPDIGIVAAYGKIIPQKIINLFPFGCLNIHPSLLPKYRGPSPIQTAILNGEKETGVTIIKLDKSMDHGPIIDQLKVEINNLNALELSQKLAQEGTDLLIKILSDYLLSKIRLNPQDDSQATFTRILKRQDGKINWQRSAIEIERQIRAFYPWPGSFSEFSIYSLNKSLNLTIKLIEVVVSDVQLDIPVGELVVKEGQLYVQCTTSSLLIKKLHPAGRREMTGQEFIRGYLK